MTYSSKKITKIQEVRLAYLLANSDRKAQLESVLEGLYIEVDKLCKKTPGYEITELTPNRVNTVIKQCKELLKGDEFIDSIAVFVAAGERPVYSDVLLILRELKQGIERFGNERSKLKELQRY